MPNHIEVLDAKKSSLLSELVFADPSVLLLLNTTAAISMMANSKIPNVVIFLPF